MTCKLQVGDQSEFVNVFSKVVGQVGPRIGAALNTNYFRFFCDKLANSFTPRFYEYIFRRAFLALLSHKPSSGTLHKQADTLLDFHIF